MTRIAKCAGALHGTTCLAATALLLFVGTEPGAAAPIETVVYRSGNEGYNIYRIPTIVTAANGDLLAFAEARSGGDASELDIVVKRSSDKGQTWSGLSVVQDNANFRQYFSGTIPQITVGNQTPVVDMLDRNHEGRIWLPFTLENDRVFVTYSDDDGSTWSAAREITATAKNPSWNWYATGPVHGIQLTRGEHAGRLIIPSDHTVTGGGAGAQVVYSDDHGATWQLGAVDSRQTPPSNTTPNENFAVELVDGRIYFNARDGNSANPGNRTVAYSSDGGLTYTAPGFAQDPLITTPVVQNSGLRFKALDQGDDYNLVVYAGPADGSTRRDLALRFSYDETESWVDTSIIHAGPAAYSDLVKLDGERLGVLFEAGATLYSEILFSTVKLSDFSTAPLNGIPGDVNQDGAFNAADVSAFVSVWNPGGTTTYAGDRERYMHGDLNLDGARDLYDVFVLRQLLIQNAIPLDELANLGVVPEPGTCALILTAWLCQPVGGTAWLTALAARLNSSHDIF